MTTTDSIGSATPGSETNTGLPNASPGDAASRDSWSRRLGRLGYLLAIGAATTFALSFFVIAMIEAAGPSETQSGRVLDRITGESTVTRCPQAGTTGSGCRTLTYPNYTVIGERSDGTTWLVVGEPAFDAMRGQSGEIDVTTSSVTGRVVGLDGDDSWTISSSGQTIFAIGALVVIGGIALLWEFVGRRRRWNLGQFTRAEFVALVPAVLIGLAATWFVLFSKGWGLEAVSSGDEFGGFLDDPVAFLNDEPEPAGAGNPIPVGRWTGTSASEIVIVGVDDLAEEYRSLLGDGGELLAIPVMQRDTSGGIDQVQLHLVAEDEFFVDGVEPFGCPESLPAFGTRKVEQQGFVCFDAAAAAGRELQRRIGSGNFASDPLAMEFDPAFI